MLKLIYAIKCLNIHMHSQIHSQDSLHFTLTLAVLHGAALPHLKRGTAVTQVTVGGWGYLYPSYSTPTALLNLLLIPAHQKQKRAAL